MSEHFPLPPSEKRVLDIFREEDEDEAYDQINGLQDEENEPQLSDFQEDVKPLNYNFRSAKEIELSKRIEKDQIKHELLNLPPNVPILDRPPTSKTSDQVTLKKVDIIDSKLNNELANSSSYKQIYSQMHVRPSSNHDAVRRTNNRMVFSSPGLFDMPINKLNEPLIFNTPIPKNLLHSEEKEILYENSQKLKHAMNHLIDENVKLKTLIQNNEEEIIKKDKLINEIYLHLSGAVKSNSYTAYQLIKSNTPVVLSLKRKLKEQKLLLKEKSERIDIITKSIKHFNLQDLENQSQIMNDECIRLKKILGELIKQENAGNTIEITELESKINQQKDIINKLISDKDNLEHDYQSKELEFNQIRYSLQELDSKIEKMNRMSQELAKAKKENLELKSEIEKLNEIYQRKLDESKTPPKKSLLENRIEELKKKLEDMRLQHPKNIDRIKEEHESQLKEKKGKFEVDQSLALSKLKESSIIITPKVPKSPNPKIKLSLSSLQNESKTMKLNLQLNKIEFDSISQMNWVGNKLNVEDVQQILMDIPFQLSKSYSEKVLNYILSTLGPSSNNISGKDLYPIIEKIVGKYNLISIENYEFIENLKEKLKGKEIIKAIEKSIIKNFDFDGLDNFFDRNNIDIDIMEIETLELILYSKTKDITSINAEIFKNFIIDLKLDIIISTIKVQPEEKDDYIEELELLKNEENESNIQGKNLIQKAPVENSNKLIGIPNDKKKNIKFILNKEDIPRLELEYQMLIPQLKKQYLNDCSLEITKQFIHWKSTVQVYFSKKKFFKEFEGEFIEAIDLNAFLECLNENNVITLDEIKFYCLVKYLTIDEYLGTLNLRYISSISNESEINQPNHDYINKSIISNIDKLSDASLSILYLLKENSKPGKLSLYEIFKNKILKRNFVLQEYEMDDNENLDLQKPTFYFAINSNDFFLIVQKMGPIPKEELLLDFKNEFKKKEESDPNYLYFSKIKVLTRELFHDENFNFRSEAAYKKIASDFYLISSNISENIQSERNNEGKVDLFNNSGKFQESIICNPVVPVKKEEYKEDFQFSP